MDIYLSQVVQQVRRASQIERSKVRKEKMAQIRDKNRGTNLVGDDDHYAIGAMTAFEKSLSGGQKMSILPTKETSTKEIPTKEISNGTVLSLILPL